MPDDLLEQTEALLCDRIRLDTKNVSKIINFDLPFGNNDPKQIKEILMTRI
jgi:hypothetical protein